MKQALSGLNLNDLITSTQKKISDAQGAAEKLRERSAMIQKRLDKVEVVEYEEKNLIEETLDIE